MQKSILNIAKETIALEAKALNELLTYLNEDFEKAVKTIYDCKGRLVISGIGKSAIVAQKIVASLNSTGTPSLFLHAADAIHGDIGMVQQDDIVMIISKSGDSPEIKVLVPIIKNFRNPFIALCGNVNSYLARSADILLNSTVSAEACPINLAPTSSSVAQIAIGDALVVCLMNLRGFTAEDFAKFHPGGTLGKKLYLHVSDLFINNEKPVVHVETELRDAIIEITKKRLGVTVVLNQEEEIVGIITDGDLRRMLENDLYRAGVKAKEIMTVNPKTIDKNELAVQALDLMRKMNITQLIVTDNKKYVGIIHLHDLVREGII
ncbi:MAG: KpsF/GutQ family sugar-phosphate isomerase [Ginsengibacter sp.]|jgi:arabinose-5-phosphate isomerase